MAYASDLGRSHSISGVSWIDGVQVKIGDKFLPPKKVTLPLDFQMGNPSEVLFMEYDFSLEEKVLQWSEAQRQMKEAQQAQKEEAECINRDQPVEEPNHDPGPENGTMMAEQPVPNGNAIQPMPNGQAPMLQPHNSNATVPTGQTANPLLNFGSGILMPTPITTSGVPAQNASVNASSKSSFDPKDFENENDPFESLELKVLNDREELNKMLLGVQGTVSQQQTDVQQGGECQQQGGSPSLGTDNGDLPQGAGSLGESAVSTGHSEATAPNLKEVAPVQSTGQPPPIPTVMSLKDVDYPSIESLSLDSILGPSNSLPSGGQNSVPVAKSSNSVVPAPNAVGSYAQSGSGLQMQAGSGQVYFSNKTQTVESASPMVAGSGSAEPSTRTVLPPIPSARYLIQQPAQSQPGFSTQNANSVALNFPVDKSKHGGLDFYSRHAVNYVPNGIASHAIEGRPSSGRQTPPMNPLRSVRSTPDISGSDERQERPSVPSAYTPPPYTRLRTDSPPSRPSSQQAWNPYSVLPAAPSPSESNPSTPRNRSHSTSYPGQSSSPARGASLANTTRLPDPYPNLSQEAQRFINNISDMGFPRARVARAVEKLGEDDKQVIDHLCLVDRLLEMGHKEMNAVTALHLFDNKEEKACQYLKLASQFRELGFSDDKIREALVTSDLDEHKTLDLLTAT